jgi:lipoprotein
MRTSLFLGMTGFAFLTTFGLQGCSDDDGGNGGKIPPPRLMLRWVM